MSAVLAGPADGRVSPHRERAVGGAGEEKRGIRRERHALHCRARARQRAQARARLQVPQTDGPVLRGAREHVRLDGEKRAGADAAARVRRAERQATRRRRLGR